MINYSIELKDERFAEVVAKIISDHGIREIIETGTYLGTGSTVQFAKTGLSVHTIECNPVHYMKACDNLSPYKNVHCHLGYSLKLKDLRRFIREDGEFYKKCNELKVEVDGEMPQSFYLGELGVSELKEDLLPELADNTYPQIVFLDSAGGTGWPEYQAFMNFQWVDKKVLMLDDIQHVKHWRSVRDLKDRGYEFVSFDNRWGYCVIKGETHG